MTTPGDTVGKRQPNIPKRRVTVVANYRFIEALGTSIGVRHSGQQYHTLSNVDVNGYTSGISTCTRIEPTDLIAGAAFPAVAARSDR